jgi:hypothetical protein
VETAAAGRNPRRDDDLVGGRSVSQPSRVFTLLSSAMPNSVVGDEHRNGIEI